MINLLSKNVVSKGFLSVYKMIFNQTKFNGEEMKNIQREVLYRNRHVVFLTLIDKKNQKMLLVKQARAGAIIDNAEQPYTIEPIAGVVDEGYTPIEVAIKEAKEEANIDLNVEDLSLMKSCYLSPGISNEYGHFYYAEFDSENYEVGQFGVEEESEDIQTLVLSMEELESQKEHLSVTTLVSMQKFQIEIVEQLMKSLK